MAAREVSSGRVPTPAALLFQDGVVDPLAQGVRDVVLAAVGDHLAQLGLEVEGAEARGALVEMFA